MFVIILQLQVGEKSLEEILDQTLKESVVGVYFQNLTKTGAEMVENNVKGWISGDDNNRSLATPSVELPAKPVEYIDISSADSSQKPTSAP